MLRLADVIAGAQFRCDLTQSDRVSQFEWCALAVKAIKSVWVLAAGARPDFQVSSKDFTIASGGTASFAVPNDFFDIIDVVFGPDTANEYSLGPFAWQNRRAPGGWFPPGFGGVTNFGGNAARLMGGNVYIEPSVRAGGTYRLWYCPRAQAMGPLQVRLVTVATLPAALAFGTGPGHGIQATANGALTVDGQLVAAGDRILVTLGAASGTTLSDCGIYAVVAPGSAGTPWVLNRATDYDQVPEIAQGDIVVASAGTQANIPYQLQTWGNELDTGTSASQFFYTNVPAVDAVLDPFGELIEILTALPPLTRDDDLDPRPLQLRAFGADGKSGLAGDLKAYFSQVRYNNGPSKMIDLDARGPRVPWGW